MYGTWHSKPTSHDTYTHDIHTEHSTTTTVHFVRRNFAYAAPRVTITDDLNVSAPVFKSRLKHSSIHRFLSVTTP